MWGRTVDGADSITASAVALSLASPRRERRTRPITVRSHSARANPYGLASIRAAAHPAKVDYLYYARKPDKVHHFFTASGDAFNAYLATHGYGAH